LACHTLHEANLNAGDSGMIETSQYQTSMSDLTAGVLIVNVGALSAFLISPLAPECPLAGVSILAFIFAQASFPACRFSRQVPLCPSNFAQGFFWIQMVLVTVLVGYWGFQQGVLPHIPSKNALNTAILIRVVGYLAFCAAYQCLTTRHRAGQASSLPTRDQRSVKARGVLALSKPNGVWSSRLIFPFAVLGLTSFFLSYGGIQGFIEYFTDPELYGQQREEPTTLAAAASTFLRYFLGFAIVLAWSLWIDRQDRFQRRALCAIVTAGAFMLLLFASSSYNRGSILGPALALAAAFSLHVWRIPFKAVILAGVLAFAAALAFGSYRSNDVGLQETAWAEAAVEFAQIYASAPQMGAFMIEDLDRHAQSSFGSTLISSLVYPIPIVGKPFRESSGVHIFNMLIYGDPDVLDQVVPLDAELYSNFHFPGVAAGYALLGWVLSYFQFRFMSAPNAVESYSWMTLALWTVFPGSLPVLSQMYVYAFWPIYVYMGFNALTHPKALPPSEWQRGFTRIS
jgi:hypothetical protein